MAKVFTPRPYQSLMMEHIWKHPRCALWAFMGAGKTVSALTAMEDLAVVEPIYPMLIIAPLKVALTTWPNELREWEHLAHLTAIPLCGTAAQRERALRIAAPIYTINFESLPWLVKVLGDRWPFKTVIIDEATKLKGFRSGGKKTRATSLAQVIHQKVDRVVELTGTPAPNGLQDLWGQLWFLDAGKRLGRTYTAFKDRWFNSNSYTYEVTPKEGAMTQIIDAVSNICLTINAEDYFDLQAPVVQNLKVVLPPKARQLYDDLQRLMFIELSAGDVTATTAAARSQKCLQVAAGALYLDEGATAEWEVIHDEKLDMLEQLIDEFHGENILVSYQYKADLARLKDRFPQGVHLDNNPATERNWNKGLIPLLFAHPMSAGHGMNLQHGGRVIVHLNLGWNYEGYAQINERLGPVRQRQAGYERTCFVYHLLAEDTVDYGVLERLTTKRDVQDILLTATAKGSWS